MNSRKAYEDKLKAQAQEWTAKIDQLKAKASQADADARLEIQERIKDLEDARNDAEGRLEELASAGEDRWQDLKKTADDAVAGVERKLSEALDKVG